MSYAVCEDIVPDTEPLIGVIRVLRCLRQPAVLDVAARRKTSDFEERTGRSDVIRVVKSFNTLGAEDFIDIGASHGDLLGAAIWSRWTCNQFDQSIHLNVDGRAMFPLQ